VTLKTGLGVVQGHIPLFISPPLYILIQKTLEVLSLLRPIVQWHI